MNLLFVAVLLSCLSAYLGFLVGRYTLTPTPSNSSSIGSRYFEGLNFLLNEQPDKAVDVFIEMIEVNSDTVETHLALGSLFRRRGEVDRAIRVHQNLIARPSLSRSQRVQALYELGQDYMSAGVLDRAEVLFQELVGMGEHKKKSLIKLIDIYQQQHDWFNAIEMAKKLEDIDNRDTSRIVAHYFCELAEESKAEGGLENTTSFIKKALNSDPKSVRAHFLQADTAMKLGRIQQAISIYEYIAEYHPVYITEVLQPIANCYEQIRSDTGFQQFLVRHSLNKSHLTVVSAALNNQWNEQNSDQLEHLLAEKLVENPTIFCIKAFVDIQCVGKLQQKDEKWLLVQQAFKDIMTKYSKYQCKNCGFSANKLYWFCPGCKHWDSIQPLGQQEVLST